MHAVDHSAGTVAKIYSKAPSAKRVEKLRAMVASVRSPLVEISAWPTDLVFKEGASTPVGFLMPRITDHRELHELYSPAHRKQKFPEANWAFLIHVARNLAAAVDTVHEHGHVIGDINQKGVLVSRAGLVKLIDCDSFQITTPHARFLCEVGVGDFTPPELQGRAFSGVVRTKNHDGFGLAILCFQLLFMGRHPYSGHAAGLKDDSLEAAIKALQFAYGSIARSKGIRPPPSSPPIETVPSEIRGMFETAFTETGVNGARPAAADWVRVLDRLRAELNGCLRISTHVFHKSLSACPWCALEKASRSLLFVAPLPHADTAVHFDIEKAWQLIRAVSPPKGLRPLPSLAPAVPRPLPPEVLRAGQSYTHRRILGSVMGATVALLAILFMPAAIPLGLIPFLWGLAAKLSDGGETDARRKALKNAEAKLTSAKNLMATLSSDDRFGRAVSVLEGVANEYRGLAGKHQRGLEALRNDARRLQEVRFLQRQFIDEAKIDGIGPGRRAALASNGIETAADLTWDALYQLQGVGLGIGPTSVANLMAWRASVEKRFRFDPGAGIDPHEKASLDQRLASDAQRLRAVLLAGPGDLQSLSSRIEREQEVCREELLSATTAFAQAEADARLLVPSTG